MILLPPTDTTTTFGPVYRADSPSLGGLVVPPARRAATAVPVEWVKEYPIVLARSGTETLRLILDTGSPTSFLRPSLGDRRIVAGPLRTRIETWASEGFYDAFGRALGTRVDGFLGIEDVQDYRLCLDPAARAGIAHQMEVISRGGIDAGGVQRLHGGIPSFTLSIPTRDVHTPDETVHVNDVEASIALLVKVLEEIGEADLTLA